jgi:hypothetical protein
MRLLRAIFEIAFIIAPIYSNDYNKKLHLELVNKQLEIKLTTSKEFNDYMTVNNDIKLLNEDMLQVNTDIDTAFKFVEESEHEYGKKEKIISILIFVSLCIKKYY